MKLRVNKENEPESKVNFASSLMKTLPFADIVIAFAVDPRWNGESRKEGVRSFCSGRCTGPSTV